MAYKSQLFTRIIACLLVCIYCAGNGFSQPSNLPEAQHATPPLRLVTAANGLPKNALRSVVQDDAGFMWIATNGDGLVRYDGKNTRLFTHKDGDSNSLTSNLIWSIHRDGMNRFWIIYHNGAFDLFNPVTEKVRHLSAELHFFQKAAAVLKVPNVEPIGVSHMVFEDSKHRLWISFEKLMVRVDASGGGSMVMLLKNLIENSPVVTYNEMPGGHLLVATRNNIWELDEAFRVVRRTAQPANSFKAVQNSFPGYSLLKNDTLYISAAAGITVYNIRTGQAFFRGGIPQTAIRADKVTSPHNDQFLFYDIASTHLYQYTIGNASFTDLGKYDYALQPAASFSPGWLTYCYDKWGSLWHVANNVFYSTVAKKPFAVVSNTEDFLNQITRYFYHLFTDGSKWNETDAYSPWVSSPSGAIYIVDSTRKLRRVGQALNTTNKYTDSSGKWQVVYTGGSETLQSDNAYDAYGRLWVADPKRQELFTIDTLGQVRVCPQKLPDELLNYYSIKAAGNGSCWVIYLHKGLALYNLEKGLVKVISRKTGPNHLPETSLYEMVRDGTDPNIIWITTLGSGIVRFHEKEETLQIYTERDGWPSNTVLTPVVDAKEFLWYQTASGIYRYDTRNNLHLLMVDSAYYKGAAWQNAFSVTLNKTHFWFSNSKESVIIDVDKIAAARQVSTVLTAIKINNKLIRDGDTSLVPAPLNTLPELRLAYDQNFISLQFAALSYAQPGQARYRYQLVGIDKDWVDNGNEDIAQYTSLPPGSYTFKVNTINEDGAWSSEVKSIRIVISPPWWRTGWMYAVYILMLAGVIYWFVKTRLRRLQLRQQVVLKQKEAEQAQALEETKSRFFANITHELRTPLTLILSPVQRQLQEGAATYSPQLLQGVYQNSQTLLRLINQLLDMSKLEGGNMPVTLFRGDVVLFVEGIVATFNRQAQAKDILLSYENDSPTAPVHAPSQPGRDNMPESTSAAAPVRVPTNRNTPGPALVSQVERENKEPVPVREDTNRGGESINQGNEEYLFDSDKLEKILYNLLSNAFKFTPEKGYITVTVHKREIPNNKVLFTFQVADSGVGIPSEHLPHIFNRFYQVNTSTTRRYEGTGIGLSLVKEFTELIGGTIGVESQPGSGSTFTLSLPLAVATGKEPATMVTPLQAPTTETAPATTEPMPAQREDGPLVLVTDDNEELRHFISASLAPHYRVITAVNGEDGLQKAVVELPELIISDVMMPVMDGYEFCQQVKENPLTSHIGFILLTAKTADESRVSGLRLGADHYIGKPFIVEELLLVASNLLKRQQQLRNLYSNQLQQPTEKLPPVLEMEDPFLQSVYAVIENHLDSDRLDVDFLASKMAVSRRTLNRKLATVADTSANELIRHYRLKKAAGLLLQGEAVSSAAYATGFSTPSYFSQCFKEMYGVTPVLFAENGGMSQN